MVHLDRPFNIGDKIRSPDRQIEGVVEHIGWRQTSLRAANMAMLFVPNSLFTSIVVENSSRISHRKIEEVIGLRYEDINKIEAIVSDIRAMLFAHPNIDTAQILVVAFNRFAESSVDITVQAVTRTAVLDEFHRIKQDVLLKISTIVLNHGADFAFPTRIHLTSPA
jgi:MscS family membrane protein